VGLADRVGALAETRSGRDLARRDESRFAVDQWISDYLIPGGVFGYGGHSYPFGMSSTHPGQRITETANTLPGYSAALRGCPPAFAAQMVRALVLSQARFTFRGRPGGKNARKLFGSRELSVLERPWTNATTGELVSRMEWHAGLAGNAYVARIKRRDQDYLKVLRPDWVAVVYGSEQEPEDAAYALDGEVVGYVYANGGLVATGSGDVTGLRNDVRTLLPEQVAHWSPLPDPDGAGIGMSWVTPALRDIQGDVAATEHKLQFFRQGATPNLVVKGIPAMTKGQFDEIVEMLESRHKGLQGAYKTLYLAAGADATVVGSNFRDMDLKNIQGANETRIAFLSRVPAPLLMISEGLAGSSLNSGNFAMARRIFADSWVYPALQDLASALSTIVKVPADAELWYDPTDMPILREDAKDVAEIFKTQILAIEAGMRAGFKPDAMVKASMANDASMLVGQHTGLSSVQMRPATEAPPEDTAEPALDLTRPGA
jgi:phage portal protein BeeE